MPNHTKPSHGATGPLSGPLSEQGACLKAFRKKVWGTQKEMGTDLHAHGVLDSACEQNRQKTVRRWEQGWRQPDDEYLIGIAKAAKAKGFRRRSGGHLIALLRDIYRLESLEGWLSRFDIYKPAQQPTGGPFYGGQLLRDESGKRYLDPSPPSGPCSEKKISTHETFSCWEVEGPGWAWIIRGREDILGSCYVAEGVTQSFLLPHGQDVRMTDIFLEGPMYIEMARFQGRIVPDPPTEEQEAATAAFRARMFSLDRTRWAKLQSLVEGGEFTPEQALAEAEAHG